MSILARLTALIIGASAPVRDPRLPRVSSTITDGRLAPEHEARLIEAGRKAVDDILARTHVERSGHFDAPRFGA